MKKICLASLGWISVGLALVGIFLPLLPTTPFLLLASWCFARSSSRFHDWLHAHPKLGPVVNAWESGEGLPITVKVRIIIVMWCGMAISMLIVSRLMATIGLSVIGLCVMFYILKQPTKAKVKHSRPLP